MPSKQYALATGGAKRLEVAWSGGWKNLTVRLDGREIGSIPGAKELKAGREFALDDGSRLKVQLVQAFLASELQLHRNEQPVPGSPSDPAERVRAAAGITYFVAGFNIILGLLVLMFKIGFLAQLGLGWGSILFGGLFAVLGYFVQRRSYGALLIAVILMVLDGLMGLVAASSAGRYPIGSLFVRAYLVFYMVKGLGAIRTLKDEPIPLESAEPV